MRRGRLPVIRRGRDGWLAGLLLVLDACYVAALLYVCAVAVDPTLTDRAPQGLQWFGAVSRFGAEPHQAPAWAAPATTAVVLALPALHLALRRLAGKTSQLGLIVIAAMAVSALLLGMSAYWRCNGAQAPFFAPLSWTLALFLGNVEIPFGETDAACLTSTPVALEIARLLAIATTLTAALAAAMALFRSQRDRIAIWRARVVTVVVGIEDETVSMVRAIARSQNPAGTLVVLTDNSESDAARIVRDLGARVRTVNLTDLEAISALSLWDRLDRLYLLSPDPTENLQRFKAIDEQVDRSKGGRARIPLTVRIDDPWQAEVWRRSFLASTERSWVADAVGRYEVSAAKLVRHLTTQRVDTADMAPPSTVVLCGLYPLTYALASELAQLQRELQLYEKAGVVRPANVIIFAKGAQSFVDDHEIRQGRMAPDGTMLPVAARDEEPTVDKIAKFLDGKDPASCAIVLGDDSMDTQGTRLASRFPKLRVYLASAASTSLVDISIVGHLYSCPINLELDPDAPQDVWERAAELIHEQYSSGTARDTPATRPWRELDPFIRQSNRRQLLNALWMVETMADHTWNSLEEPEQADPLPDDFRTMEPLEQLAILGFDPSTVERMVRAEHEDWRAYYEEAGWKYADDRVDARRHHDKLLPWDEMVKRKPEFVHNSHRSLASTLMNLRNLGYRSVPRATDALEWRQYRRLGEVTAEKRASEWTWTTRTGEVMHAKPGDWVVTDDGGNERSVAADAFEATHEVVGPGRYRRSGTVLARRATRQEVIKTLEGDAIAHKGDWIVLGSQGESWPLPDEQFTESYEGPLDGESID